MSVRLERDELVTYRPLDTVTTNNNVQQTQQYTNHAGAQSVVGEINQQAAMLKLSLTRQAPQTPAPQPITPDDALNQINALPVPKLSDTPHNLPPDDRKDILDGMLEEYNRKRAEIADNAIRNSKPPKREDFKDLPPQVAKNEYQEALNNYNQQIAELKKISREAKQANLEMSPEFKSLSPENQELVRKQLSNLESNPGDVDTLVKLVKSEGFTSLPAGSQKEILNDSEALKNVMALVNSKGFDGLSADTQKAMLNALGSRPKDTIFREALSNLIQNGSFTGLTPAQQVGVIRDLDKFATTSSYNSTDVSNADRTWLLQTIGDISIYSAQHPGLVSVRNTLNQLVSGDIRVVTFSEPSKFLRGITLGRANGGTIELNTHPDARRGIAELAETAVHEVNHILNGETEFKSVDRFIDEYRAWVVGIEASGQPIDANTLKGVLDNLGHSKDSAYPQLRDLYLKDEKFRKVIDDAYNGLNKNPPELITPEQLRQKLLDAGFDTVYLRTPKNLDNHSRSRRDSRFE